MIAQCESHTAHVPLHALSRMLRAMFGIHGLDAATARAHIAAQLEGVVEPDSSDSDILFDLLSIGDPETTAPTMKPDARRRRLIEVMGKVAKTRPARTLFVVEDLTGSTRPAKKFREVRRNPDRDTVDVRGQFPA